MSGSRRGRWQKIVLFGLALVASCEGPLCPGQGTLPIYRLATPVVDATIAQSVGMSLLASPGTVSETADRFFYRSGDTRVEIYKASGGVWAEDSTALWRPDLKPVLRDTSQIASMASRFVFNGRPSLEGIAKTGDSSWVMFEPRGFGKTLVSTYDIATKTATTNQLDVSINFGARIEGRKPLDQDPGLPTVGGGGELKAIYGDQGRLIGFSGVWRSIERVEQRARVIPLAQAQAKLIAAARGQIQIVESWIAYYSAPPSLAQTFLYPVYVLRVHILLSGKPYYLRDIMVPATTFDPQPAMVLPPPPIARSTANTPRTGSTSPEGPEEGGSGPSVADWREFGASWQGLETGGLEHSADNVKGFIETMKANGWFANFGWGDKSAWYTDWMDDRKNWVDAADIVFYSGHAGPNGWTAWDSAVGARRSVSLVDEAVAASNRTDVWGADDLEYIVVSGCGPLQDEKITPGDGSVFERWGGAFGGLHLLLGFATESTDTPDEGRLFATYAHEGNTVVDSWFRATTESQATLAGKQPVWSGVMWSTRLGQTPIDDKLWGLGVVAPDLKGANQPDHLVAMWTQL